MQLEEFRKRFKKEIKQGLTFKEVFKLKLKEGDKNGE